jgi:hypothetical protein
VPPIEIWRAGEHDVTALQSSRKPRSNTLGRISGKSDSS